MISEYYLLRGLFQPKQFGDLVTDILGWEESKINAAKKYEKIQQAYYCTKLPKLYICIPWKKSA